MHFSQMTVSKRCSSPHREQGLLIFSSNECSIFRITVWQATGNKTAPNGSGFLINSYLNSKMKDIKGQMNGASLFHPNSCASSDWRHAAAHVELYIAFPLWHLFCGISTRSTSEKVTQTHENQPQILSDQSVRLNAAQRWAKRVHTNRGKGVIIRRANSQSSFVPPIHDGNFFKIHTLKTMGVFSAYWFTPSVRFTQKPQTLQAGFPLWSTPNPQEAEITPGWPDMRPHWKHSLKSPLGPTSLCAI